MPKRPISELECEDSRLQSKIHVGLKEVNQGICSDSNMKAVYQKTLDLLFRGSKPKVCPETNLIPPPVAIPSKYSQMTITPSGLISHEPRKETATEPITLLTCQCPSCLNSYTMLPGKCKFCEMSVCEGCQKPCAMCLGEYCTKCSMKVYSREEFNVCFSCATERGQQFKQRIKCIVICKYNSEILLCSFKRKCVGSIRLHKQD